MSATLIMLMATVIGLQGIRAFIDPALDQLTICFLALTVIFLVTA